MSKYQPLWEYIKDNDVRVLDFDQLGRVLGFAIDHSFQNAKKELPDHGFEMARISLLQRRVFIRKSEE